jgi:hypothetical protein
VGPALEDPELDGAEGADGAGADPEGVELGEPKGATALASLWTHDSIGRMAV